MMADFLFLWHSYRTLIAKFIHARVRYDTRETREDMVQEVYARAWAAMCKGYGASYHPRSWLFQIAANLITDYYRERGKRPACEVLDAYGDDGERLGTMPAPDEIVDETLAVEHLQRVASTLTPAQAHVILRRLDGYTFAEIAAEMGVGEGAVKSVKFRAAQQMRRYVEQR